MPWFTGKLFNGSFISINISTNFDPSDLPGMVRSKTTYLKYHHGDISKFYIHSKGEKLGSVLGRIWVGTPYVKVINYLDPSISEKTRQNWGQFKFIDHFRFPTILRRHRELMIGQFNKKQKLRKGNLPAPRVYDVSPQNEGPVFELHHAHYYDQVGTNLTLDYHHKEPIIDDIHNVREWDCYQAGVGKQLPWFSQSNLANTIGVAVAITARNSDGKRITLRRKRRRNKVAVYQDTWHVPLSFALCYSPEDFPIGHPLVDIKSLIMNDLSTEQFQELGLDIHMLKDPQPLAFCRDVIRGGKPQFFFEMESMVPFEELITKIKPNDNEYVTGAEIAALKDYRATEVSTELHASLLLLINKYGQEMI